MTDRRVLEFPSAIKSLIGESMPVRKMKDGGYPRIPLFMQFGNADRAAFPGTQRRRYARETES